MKHAKDPLIDRVVRSLLEQGWTIKHGGNHKRISDPTGRHTLPFTSNSTDHRAGLNFRTQIRRLGINV